MPGKVKNYTNEFKKQIKSLYQNSKLAAKLMKKYVNSQKFTSTTEVMEGMITMFVGVLQEVMSAELDETLGYEKSQRMSQGSKNALSKNYRDGFSEKTFKTQLGEVNIKIKRDPNGEYYSSIISKYNYYYPSNEPVK